MMFIFKYRTAINEKHNTKIGNILFLSMIPFVIDITTSQMTAATHDSIPVIAMFTNGLSRNAT